MASNHPYPRGCLAYLHLFQYFRITFANTTGSEAGGKTMAVLFSLVSSCQRHGHDPFVYLRDVLTRLLSHPKERLVDLLPDRWTSSAPTEVTTGTAPLGVAESAT
jgi:hypothetical protein